MPVDAVGPGHAPGALPPDGQRLRQVAQDFEAMILSHMLASMRQASAPAGPGGKGQRLYQEMMDDEMGRVLARSGGLGLADVLVRDLVRQTGSAKKASSSPPERPMSTPNGGVTPDRREGDLQ